MYFKILFEYSQGPSICRDVLLVFGVINPADAFIECVNMGGILMIPSGYLENNSCGGVF